MDEGTRGHEESSLEQSFHAVAPYYDELMAGVPYRFWTTYLQELWDHFQLKPLTILDLACGTGTVALLLAGKGYRVAGVDRSGAMLAEATRKAALADKSIEFFHQDAVELDLPGRRFDTIISLFDSLNNITYPPALQEAFLRTARHVEPGGLFIFDVNTEYAFIEGMFNQRSEPLEGPVQYDWRAKYDRGSGLCTITMDFAILGTDGSPEREFREVHIQRAYPHVDIVRMLEVAGFPEISAFDAYTLHTPRRRSDRVFYVARRSV